MPNFDLHLSFPITIQRLLDHICFELHKYKLHVLKKHKNYHILFETLHAGSIYCYIQKRNQLEPIVELHHAIKAVGITFWTH